jgi:hypothetical protein
MTELRIDGIRRAFIISNSPLERLLFNRNLIGLDFVTTCEEATGEFLRHFADELDVHAEDIAELVILGKGLHYGLRRTFAAILRRNLEMNLVATRRAAVHGQEARVDVLYRDFDAGRSNLVVGDTIASGATLCAALNAYLEHQHLAKVYVFTLAGSRVGGQRIGTFCAARGIDVTIAYGLAAFGLGANGFDLSFLHPDTIASEEYKRRAVEQFQGRAVSAVGWDFGSQAQAVEKYRNLCWIEAEFWDLQGSEAFAVAQRPRQMERVERERGAWESRLTPSLERRRA